MTSLGGYLITITLGNHNHVTAWAMPGLALIVLEQTDLLTGPSGHSTGECLTFTPENGASLAAKEHTKTMLLSIAST
jgi:hypothetical protein